MVFIKGAWLEPWVNVFPWDPLWDEYFCCSKNALLIRSHCQTFDPNTGKGSKHNPQCWRTYHCAKTPDLREIPFEDIDGPITIQRPDWCPLRKS